jgi:AcrR family transcriptional regulator
MAGTQRQRAPRTAPDVRREQLIRASLIAFANLGYAGVKVQEIADAAGVTRNLINHYFPGGKHELYVEAVRLACKELATVIDVDPAAPLDEKMPANIAAYLDEVLRPSPVYVLYARAMQSADGEVRALHDQARDAIAASIALNNLGTRNPPARVKRALVGYIAFGEATCEYYREQGSSDRTALEQLLRDVLRSVIEASQPRRKPRTQASTRAGS